MTLSVRYFVSKALSALCELFCSQFSFYFVLELFLVMRKPRLAYHSCMIHLLVPRKVKLLSVSVMFSGSSLLFLI